MLKHPKYGYVSGMNPCIDCRVMMYKAAKEQMENTDADFIIADEVLFQRPMSQNNRALHIIEDGAEITGKVLRPLSAKCLPSTDPETFVEQDDIVMQAKDYAGPTCILRSKKKNDKSILNISAGILLRCSDAPRQNKSKVIVVINGNVKKEISTNSYK
jgi:tRNA U34 2-thiouridine synthase MnmA/TrmU